MVAADDPAIAFIVLLAGPGTTGEEVLLAQGQLIVRAAGGDANAMTRQRAVQQKLFALARSGADEAKLKAAVADLEKDLDETEKAEFRKVRPAIDAQVTKLAGPWFQYFLQFDPRPVLERVRCPVLALNGAKDLQVPPKENLAGIEKALTAGENTDVTVKELPGLNHLFQTAKTGLPSEYGTLEETLAPAALEAIGEWIAKRK